jgi:hypothetical protein
MDLPDWYADQKEIDPLPFCILSHPMPKNQIKDRNLDPSKFTAKDSRVWLKEEDQHSTHLILTPAGTLDLSNWHNRPSLSQNFRSSFISTKFFYNEGTPRCWSCMLKSDESSKEVTCHFLRDSRVKIILPHICWESIYFCYRCRYDMSLQ